MNWFGEYAEIAKFNFWWQVISCYVLYMIPVSILWRSYSFFTQYAYGLLAMGNWNLVDMPWELPNIYPDNILDRLFGEHVFVLGMTQFFGLYFPIDNIAVNRIYLLFIGFERKI
jgi:lipoprotein signal peptidase